MRVRAIIRLNLESKFVVRGTIYSGSLSPAGRNLREGIRGHFARYQIRPGPSLAAAPPSASPHLSFLHARESVASVRVANTRTRRELRPKLVPDS